MRHRRDPASPARDQVRWLVVALVAGVLVWIPPVIDQVRHDPGNLTILYRYFSNPPETSIGYVTGLKVMLVQLNPWGNWLTGGWITTSGTPIPGALLLVVWAVLAAVVSASAYGRLLRLNLVIGAGVVLAGGLGRADLRPRVGLPGRVVLGAHRPHGAVGLLVGRAAPRGRASRPAP